MIKFDPRGKDQLKYRCKHVNLVKKAVTHVPGEEEYLFAPYSCGTGRAQHTRHEEREPTNTRHATYQYRLYVH